MTALAVDVTRRLDIHHVLAQQRVRERRLARAGLPEQHGRAPGGDRGQHVDAVPGGGAHGQHRHTGRGRLHVLDEIRQRHRVRHEVGLGQHDQGLGPGLPGEREEPFDTAEVEFPGQRHRDDRVVDVGREDLPLGSLGGGGAHEGGTAGQIRPYVARGAAFGVHGDPVARAHDLHRVTGTTNSVSARTVPAGVTTSHRPRSTRATRPGRSPCSANGTNSASHSASQPYGCSGCTEEDDENEPGREEKDKG